jgi:hypothetical protein
VNEIVREIEEEKPELLETYSLFCPECSCDTPHTVLDSGEWELYFCVHCGREIKFKVR